MKLKYRRQISGIDKSSTTLTQDTEWENERTQVMSHIGEARDHPFPIK